ncbi:hypothetical protein WN51_12045 [Melipona quadrifasciata]|uniref:Uncharacterized protein n=1 Tax=Melipona quadrifasciata TaxID=166423 RepID=A0A0N0BH49_9HYME|nr:hypothetical protein WN51_12045 [Melipona quadrifasciata]
MANKNWTATCFWTHSDNPIVSRKNTIHSQQRGTMLNDMKARFSMTQDLAQNPELSWAETINP